MDSVLKTHATEQKISTQEARVLIKLLIGSQSKFLYLLID